MYSLKTMLFANLSYLTLSQPKNLTLFQQKHFALLVQHPSEHSPEQNISLIENVQCDNFALPRLHEKS